MVAALDKARPNLPVKPLPKKQTSQAENGEKSVRGTKPVANSKNAVKKVRLTGMIINKVSVLFIDRMLFYHPIFVINYIVLNEKNTSSVKHLNVIIFLNRI